MRARALLPLALTVAACTLPAAAAAHRSDLPACNLISTGKLASILGVEHVQIQKDLPGTSSADNVSGVTHSVCNGLAWTGAAPATRSAALAAVANGRAAAFALDTWAPDDASTYESRWTSKGFTQLTLGATVGSLVLPGFPKFAARQVRRLLQVGGKDGDNATGIMATPFPGIEAASGTWWSDDAHAIVSITFGGSAGKPTMKELNELAGIAVKAFGLAPLRLRLK